MQSNVSVKTAENSHSKGKSRLIESQQKRLFEETVQSETALMIRFFMASDEDPASPHGPRPWNEYIPDMIFFNFETFFLPEKAHIERGFMGCGGKPVFRHDINFFPFFLGDGDMAAADNENGGKWDLVRRGMTDARDCRRPV